jgi:dienelactone hydrolase
MVRASGFQVVPMIAFKPTLWLCLCCALSGSACGEDSAGAPGANAAPSSAAGAAAPDAPSTPAEVLPAIADPAQPGPFGVDIVATAPGLETHTLFVPTPLGERGVKHPIVVWTNGAGGSTSFYDNLLRHFASHGFFVVADKMSGSNHDPEIVEQQAGIEWALAEAFRAGGPYAGKIDATRLAVAGHSLGSIASFASAAHPAVRASIHWSAGLTGNPVGADPAWLQGLHAPAAFFCGGAEARALPRCSGDFMNAPANLPIFYGTVEGVGHTDVYGEPNAGQWGRAGVAWFRFTLASDESFRSWFRAPMCTLCSNPWTGMSRGI